MGNSSCSSSNNNPTYKVITNNGKVEEFSHPMPASDLTLKHPGHFLCDSDHLHVGSRIPGLGPSDHLRPHHLYFLLPLDLLYSVLTEDELTSLTSKVSTKRTSKHSLLGRRILPVLSDFCMAPSEAKKVVVVVVVEEGGGGGGGDGDFEVFRYRSWRPALETIEEAPCMVEQWRP